MVWLQICEIRLHKVTWHVAKYGDPYSELVLCIYPSKVHTHSSEHTHTVNTHPEQWAAIYAAAPGEQLKHTWTTKTADVLDEMQIQSLPAGGAYGTAAI